MPKKPKISKDAFDWIKDTSKEAEGIKQPEPALPKPEKKIKPKVKQPLTSEVGGVETDRAAFIRYKKNGEIVGMIEIVKGEPKTHPYLNIPADEKVAEFILAGELLNKKLIDIHTHYRVDTTEKKPKLISKS